MRTKFASALSLGAVLILLGACSQSSDQPANTAENNPPPAEETAPAAPDRGVQSGRPGAAPRATAAAPAPSRYACTGTKNMLSVTHSADGASARISFGTTTVAGKRAGAGHYTAAKTDLMEKGSAATLTWQGKKYNCKAK